MESNYWIDEPKLPNQSYSHCGIAFFGLRWIVVTFQNYFKIRFGEVYLFFTYPITHRSISFVQIIKIIENNRSIIAQHLKIKRKDVSCCYLYVWVICNCCRRDLRLLLWKRVLLWSLKQKEIEWSFFRCDLPLELLLKFLGYCKWKISIISEKMVRRSIISWTINKNLCDFSKLHKA